MRLSKNLTFLSTWHPAYVGYDPSRAERSYLLHIRKAVGIALGKKANPLPEVYYNPEPKLATELFNEWKEDGFACDIETISLNNHAMLSVAVSGSVGEAMVWDMAVPGVKVRTRPLKKALASTDHRVVFQNGEFDVPILERFGWKVATTNPKTGRLLLWDTMIENQILHPDEPVNLSFLTSLSTDTEAWKHLRGTGAKELLFYNALDANFDWKVYLEALETYQDFDLQTEA